VNDLAVPFDFVELFSSPVENAKMLSHRLNHFKRRKLKILFFTLIFFPFSLPGPGWETNPESLTFCLFSPFFSTKPQHLPTAA
jgi:hypothetical protein